MKKEAKITVLFLAVLFLGFSLVCWLKPAGEYSTTERRKLEQFPKLTLESVAEGTFMTEFEEYTLDQFPLRDGFRSLKAWVSRNIFRKSDNNDIYVANSYAVKMEYPLNEKSLENAGEKFHNIYEKYLKDSGGEIYLSIIPDKNYFLAESSGHLSMDYDKVFAIMQDEMPYAEYIDIMDLLTIEDYYKTDVHWRQEEIVDVAEKIGEAMGITINGDYEMKTLEEKFYGVYFGQSALNLPGEKLHYLTNEVLEQCTVYNYENEQTLEIYDMERAKGDDPYEIFLSGPVSLLKIENPKAQTEKELIVFRDSFGSSLVPLLAEGYKSITLVDIRYIQSEFLVNFIDFANKDVLFLYSTVVLNNSETLK
ncbi:MAG: hypothetical protein IJ024_03050 [Lachnospiraceae bacterium]|nr:hypothetical protein [Lachnospiraceae bacterium]